MHDAYYEALCSNAELWEEQRQVAPSPQWKVESPLRVLPCCGAVEAPSVHLTRLAYEQIEALMDAYLNQEWLAYLVGERTERGYRVEGLVVPGQLASATDVEVTDTEPPPPGTIGVIHSHHTMGSFFSSTDDDHVNSNHRLSIVVSRLREGGALSFQASVIYPVPCGQEVRNRNVPVYVERVHDVTQWLEQARANIRRRVVRRERYGDSKSIFPHTWPRIFSGMHELQEAARKALASETRASSPNGSTAEELDVTGTGE